MSQHNRGSSFHLLQWTRKDRTVFASSLTRLINLPNVSITSSDWWRPAGDTNPVEARTENLPDEILSLQHKTSIRNWWLKHPTGANTPNWDFIGSAMIDGQKGLVLIEAKAHKKEASFEGKLLKVDASQKSKENHQHIRNAIAEASDSLSAKYPDIHISVDAHYQLANRIAYAWKFASLGIPVVLLYLGFLNDVNMSDVGEPFGSNAERDEFIQDYTRGVFPLNLWNTAIDCGNCGFYFGVRAMDIHEIGVM